MSVSPEDFARFIRKGGVDQVLQFLRSLPNFGYDIQYINSMRKQFNQFSQSQIGMLFKLAKQMANVLWTPAPQSPDNPFDLSHLRPGEIPTNRGAVDPLGFRRRFRIGVNVYITDPKTGQQTVWFMYLNTDKLPTPEELQSQAQSLVMQYAGQNPAYPSRVDFVSVLSIIKRF